MSIGSLLSIAVGTILEFPATVDVAGIELGTIGVILVILVLLAVGFALGLWVLLVVLFSIGSRPDGASGPDRYP